MAADVVNDIFLTISLFLQEIARPSPRMPISLRAIEFSRVGPQSRPPGPASTSEFLSRSLPLEFTNGPQSLGALAKFYTIIARIF